MNKAQRKKEEQKQAIAELRKILKPGDTIYTVLNHVSRSGMMRSISPFFMSVKVQEVAYWKNKNERKTVRRRIGVPVWLGGYGATALDWGRDHKKGGIKVSGCGMDAGWHLVEALSFAVFGNGYALRQEWL